MLKMNGMLFVALPLLALPSMAIPQSTTPNGLIVPFSTLPQCAALCGKLFDVQGACAPGITTQPANTCFCGDARLKPFLQSGVAGVESVCGPASCQDTPSLEAIQNWYAGYCNEKVGDGTATPTTTTTGSAATSTSTSSSGSSSSSGNQAQPVYQGWWAGHWKWIVMLIVMVIAIVGGWIGASLWRRHYLRKKERGIEMRPPVAWAPNQAQSGAGGLGQPGPNYNKEAEIGMTPANNAKAQRQSRGWLTKNRT